MLTYICASVILALFYFRYSRKKMSTKLASMSGPRRMPVLGHALNFLTATPRAIAGTLKYFSEFPSPVCIHMGPLPHVAIFDPEQLQVVLHSQNCLDKSIQYSFLRVSETLISAPGHLWKNQRKALNPSFGPAILTTFADIFNNKCAILTERLEQYAGKPERNFYRDISKCTLDQIYATAFGCDFNMQNSLDGERSLDLQEAYMKVMANRFFSVWKYPDFIYKWTAGYKKELELRRIYHETITCKLVDQVSVEDKLHTKDDMSFKTEETGKRIPENFIECLVKYLRAEGETSKDAVYPHIDMTVFAGNDTSAKTICSILLMLAIHPEVQERCYQELMEICPDKDQQISYKDAANLTYLEMVCKETMRLLPAVPLMARITTGDIKLNDQHTIPANCTIIMGIFQIHRDPRIWGPKADDFDPDNFLPDNVAKRHPYSYIPFSAGPRNCIGTRYAYLSSKIMVGSILRKYRLKTSLTMDKLRISCGLLLHISNGCQMAIEKR
ncbi:cytochrome P450 4C1-like isoform X2 [Aedes albopictus]|uniref:Cytochrome n=1 Tax=Aedes albopictus TaxID=7160 RepID=A0ABM2A7L4_AEDAL